MIRTEILKIIVVAAVFSGLIVGITFATIQSKSRNDGSLSAEASSTKELDPKNLPPEVALSRAHEEYFLCRIQAKTSRNKRPANRRSLSLSGPSASVRFGG